MKIKKLSLLTGVNTETIRMYRNKGLLSPQQESNGYYDYSFDDFLMLLFIRKQRGSEIGLDIIKYTYTNPNPDEIIKKYEEEYNGIEEKIAHLRKQQEMLKLHIDHYRSFKENEVQILRFPAYANRIDLPLALDKIDGDLSSWIADINMFIQGLHLPDNWFMQDPLSDTVKAQFTVGTYMPIIEKYNYSVPENAVFTPNGEYISCVVELKSDGIIESKQLRQLIDYANDNNLQLTNDSTAFIFRVDNRGKDTKYVFRLRVRVEQK